MCCLEQYCRGKYVRKVVSDYCVVDTETTGLSPYFDDVIEIGILRIRNNIVVDQYSQLINPGYAIPKYISDLTGITNEMLEGQPSVHSVKDAVLSFVGNDLIVGHNTHFDMQFLANQFQIDLENEYIDTVQFAKKLYPDLPNHKLTTLTEYLGITSNSHRALRDCLSTKALLDCIVRKMQDKGLMVDDVFPPKSKRRKKYALDISKIQPADVDIDEDNFFYGKHCVFTGKLEKMVRKDAMQLVVNVGGVLDRSVISTTNYLIVGGFDYCSSVKEGKSGKMKDAERLKGKGQDIEIIDEHTFYDLINLDS